MKSKKKILYLIQLPPPLHGVSIINQLVYRSETINSGFEKEVLPIRFSYKTSELRSKHPSKLMKFCLLWLRLLFNLIFRRPHLLYFSLMPVGIGFWRDLSFVVLIKLFAVPHVFHLHNRGVGVHSQKSLYRAAYHFVFKNAFVIHLSPGLIDKEIIKPRIKCAGIFSVPNGIESTKSFSEKKISVDRPVEILLLSNIMEEKGIFWFLDVYQEILETGMNVSLTIAGACMGNAENRLQKILSASPKKTQMVWVGLVEGEEKTKLYAKADIFVFPSFFREECFPLVLLEAMEAGLGIVSTHIGAIPEIIENQKEGILVPPQERTAFKNAVLSLAENQEKRLYMGRNAQKKFIANYTAPIFERNMRKTINNIISRV